MTKSVCSLVLIGLSLPFASIATSADDALQQAHQGIQSAYDAGQGKIAILHWPSAWVVDEHSFHYSKTVQTVALRGDVAQVTVRQDDSVTATDPKTGQHHVIRDAAVFQDTWKHAHRRWFLKKRVFGEGLDTIDGERLMQEN